MYRDKKHKTMTKRGVLIGLLLLMAASFGGALLPARLASAAPAAPSPGSVKFPVDEASHQCGSGKGAVKVSIDFGCQGSACKSSSPDGCSALIDALFAFIRFLSAGVGIVVVASTVIAGIQYISSRGDPNATGKAIGRLSNNVVVLIAYVFSYAILNFVIPGGFFK
jgi:hypothetical protein